MSYPNVPDSVRLLAEAYDRQRGVVRAIRPRPGGSIWLKGQELERLSGIAKQLHDEERRLGLSIGSTRELSREPYNG